MSLKFPAAAVEETQVLLNYECIYSRVKLGSLPDWRKRPNLVLVPTGSPPGLTQNVSILRSLTSESCIFHAQSPHGVWEL